MSRIRVVLIALALLAWPQAYMALGDDKPASQPARVEPVAFEKLKELMPEEAMGVKRSSHEGEKQTIGEWAMSRAKADYTSPDSDGNDARAAIEITDFGGAKEMVAGMTAWRTVPMSIENDQGYQRTVKFKDYPALEIYTKDGDTRQMIVLVNERFLVNIETAHVPEAEFKKLIEGLPLDRLAELK